MSIAEQHAEIGRRVLWRLRPGEVLRIVDRHEVGSLFVQYWLDSLDGTAAGTAFDDEIIFLGEEEA